MTTQIFDSNNQIIETPYEIVQLGSLEMSGPQDVLKRGIELASTLADFITDRRLFTVINGKKFVNVEGWTALGALIGIAPRELPSLTRQLENGDYEATVELVRVSDGAVVGCASAICGIDEPRWASKPRYQIRSMSITRATGKAFRLGFSWIMKLAGYEPTPLEELSDDAPSGPSNSLQDKMVSTLTGTISLEEAHKAKTGDGVYYKDITTADLNKMRKAINKALNILENDDALEADLIFKQQAIRAIIQSRVS